MGGNRNLARAAGIRDRRLAKGGEASSKRSKSLHSYSHQGQGLTADELKTATKGTKVIYFDSNDIMYTEEEVKSGHVGKKKNLTKMVVRVSEQEKQRLMEVEGR